MTQIEKVARLMGCEKVDDMGFIRIHPDGSRVAWFDPLTKKSDLMDVECALAEMYEIKITLAKNIVVVRAFDYESPEEICYAIETVSDSIDKSRHMAVCAVAEQIYDNRTEGK